MSDMKKEESLVKIICITALKTLAVIIMVMAFFSLCLYVANPRFCAGICNKLGWQKAEVGCYELLYARNKDSSDLYNLIVKLGSVEDYKKQNTYIDRMQELEKYDTFCQTMDKSVLDNFENQSIDKQNLVILFGTNEYLCSTKIVNLIKLGKLGDAYSEVLKSKLTDKAYELAVHSYVETLLASDIQKSQKDEYLVQIQQEFGEYLQNRLTNLESFSLETDNNSAKELIKSYTKLKITHTQYLLDSDNADVWLAYETALEEYDNLSKD